MSRTSVWNPMAFGPFCRLVAASGGCAALLASLPAPLAAQEVAVDEVPTGLCMANQRPAQPAQTAILVPASDTSAMLEKGFAEVPCDDVFASGDEQRAWRDMICTMTATQSEGVQDQIELLLGERPAVLCGMAERVLRPWQRMAETAGVTPGDPSAGE